MSIHRAYSLLTIKAVDDEQRVIDGVATTPTPDRIEDIVDPLGVEYATPLPFLWQHQSREAAIGQVTAAAPRADGIPVRIQIERDDQPGILHDRLEYAWRSIKKGLVRGLSIGFRELEAEPIKGTFGIRFKRWEWLELSAVTIPMNAEASITAIKTAARAQQEDPATHAALHRAALDRYLHDAFGITAASGPGDRGVRPSAPGVTGLSAPRRAGVPMKTYGDRLKGFAAEKAAKVARQNDIMGADDGATLDGAAQEEFDTLQREIEQLDGQMARMEILDRTNKTLARPVSGTSEEEGAATRAFTTRGNLALAPTPVITVRANREPGVGFARVVMCQMASFLQKNQISPIEIARARWPDDLAIQLYLKAAVGAGTTVDPTNAAPLAYLRDLPSEFIEFLRPMTIIGRIPGLRRVPFNVRMVGQTTGGSANWVGQAKPKPLTKFDFAQVTLGIAKLAAIAVIADELGMVSAPEAEIVVRDSLAGAVVQKMDHDFIDPAVAVAANVHPASVTNGVTALTSAGNDATAVRKDIHALVSKFTVANLDPTKAVFIMPNTLCLGLSLMVNALGQREFPEMTIQGGLLSGLPVVGSQQASLAPVPTGAGNIVVLVNASEVFLADDGSVAIDVSREASLEMSDAPTQDGAAGTGAAMVSLWQDNLLGIRAERHINWQKRRAEAVEYLGDVHWGE